MPLLVWAIPIGIGATLVMDVWAIVLKQAFGVNQCSVAIGGKAGHRSSEIGLGRFISPRPGYFGR